MSRHSGTITIGLASIAHTYAHLFILLYATVVLALEQEWGLGYDYLFALSIPATVMFGLGALPSGWLGDRWSASGMMAIFFFGTGGASILTGFATGPVGIAAGLTLLGAFASIYHPVGIPWLVKNAVNRGRALGINGVFGSFGTAGAAIVAGALIDLYGWRYAFIVPGIVAIATGCVFVYCIARGLIHEADGDRAPQPEQSRGDMKRAFAALAVTVVCTGLIYQSTSFALPKIFEERLSGLFDGGFAGIAGLVTLCYLIAGLTQLIGGELADRYRLKTVYMSCMALQIPVIAVALTLYNMALVPVAGLMIAMNVASQPAENSLMARYTPLAWRSRAFGAKFVLTLGVSSLGVALIPIIYAFTGSLTGLFFALMGFAATGTLAALALPGERPATAAAAMEAAE